MLYNDYMYAVDRSDEYLAHYGVKGMKWGVQKAIESGNSRKLARQYRKAQKKLARLEKRANNSNKYAKRAAVLGAGAAIAGGTAGGLVGRLQSGITNKAISATRKTFGGKIAASNIVKPGQGARGLTDTATKFAGAQKGSWSGLVKKPGQQVSKVRGIADTATGNLGAQVLPGKGPSIRKPGQMHGFTDTATGNLGRQTGVMNPNFKPNNFAKPGQGARGLADTATGNIGAQRTLSQIQSKGAGSTAAKGLSRNQMIRIGAGALGAGLLGAAAYNAYRARTSDKAAQKAQQFRSEMNKAFAGTQYANGGKGSSGGSKKRRRR